MSNWNIVVTDVYERKFKWFEKKRPNELKAVLDNLDTYVSTLEALGNPMQVTAGFIHHEPCGIKAIDQKGGSTVKLKQTRLYLFAHEKNKNVYLMTIGMKDTQKKDITLCVNFVRDVTKNHEMK